MENNNILSQIGNTPLVKLKQASELLIVIYTVKQNISIQVSLSKDRAALFIVQDAIKKKKLRKVEQ